MNSGWPVERLSTPTTVWPRESRRSVRELPIKPAAPVTSTRIVLFRVSGRLAQHRIFVGANGGQPATNSEDIFHILNISEDQIKPRIGIVPPSDLHLFQF